MFRVFLFLRHHQNKARGKILDLLRQQKAAMRPPRGFSFFPQFFAQRNAPLKKTEFFNPGDGNSSI
jgi:hypothetical protein